MSGIPKEVFVQTWSPPTAALISDHTSEITVTETEGRSHVHLWKCVTCWTALVTLITFIRLGVMAHDISLICFHYRSSTNILSEVVVTFNKIKPNVGQTTPAWINCFSKINYRNKQRNTESSGGFRIVNRIRVSECHSQMLL